MINKILAHFPNSVTQDFYPEESGSAYYWFKENDEDTLWVGIPKNELADSQLELLKALFHTIEIPGSSRITGAALSWQKFLFNNGTIPFGYSDSVRIIQFQFHAKKIDREEISEAMQGFFPEHIIIWQNESYGLLIEEKKEVSVTAEELESISSTFESDFFVKLSFYLGKFQSLSPQFPAYFLLEKNVFMNSFNLATKHNVYTFEKSFPFLLTSNMPETLKGILQASVLEAFSEDKELMSTIKVFLESNSNASLAAKKLYVHRNTLQYRMDKFMEKTGVQLKDFDTAVMVYLACLYEEMR
jgi:sugar diacid utilization regulator